MGRPSGDRRQQDIGRRRESADAREGWLLEPSELHSRRAPGNTCLSALRQGGNGTLTDHINDSKGCGGVMRVAPVGLAYPEDSKRAFRVAAEAAALTHGHPSGYLSAGALALIISEMLQGKDLREAIADAQAELPSCEEHDEMSDWLERTLAFADQGREAVTPESIDEFGGGWVGEEALAISLVCALVADDFSDGVKLAVNHSGDSDSTGQIAGAILGLQHGAEGIPARALEELELREAIDELAGELHDRFGAKETLTAYRGAMLGSAVGDALGGAVEFMSTPQIFTKFPGGISRYAAAYGKRGAITDNTQMTLFTAEGLLLADQTGEDDPVENIRQAYLRWLETQTGRSSGF
jgi:ADP-ribosylglycohydrolase